MLTMTPPTTHRNLRLKTWEIIELGIAPAANISLCCPHCAEDAVMPIARTESPVIASVGLGLIFDDPCYRPGAAVLPVTIRCRTCRHTFTRKPPTQ
jgi:hypothetical protein